MSIPVGTISAVKAKRLRQECGAGCASASAEELDAESGTGGEI